jgi:DinB family protein
MDVDLLLRILDEAFSKRAWHGPNLMQSLRGVKPAEAVRRPGPKRHSIWELALHAAYWKYVVRRKLLGLRRGSFERAPSNFPSVPSPATERAWRRDIEFLKREHALLLEAVGQAKLDPRSTRLAYGAALHDVYHAGQIRLVRRLIR